MVTTRSKSKSRAGSKSRASSKSRSSSAGRRPRARLSFGSIDCNPELLTGITFRRLPFKHYEFVKYRTSKQRDKAQKLLTSVAEKRPRGRPQAGSQAASGRQSRSKTPAKRKPGRPRSKTPARGRSKTPARGRSKTPARGRSKTPARKASSRGPER